MPSLYFGKFSSKYPQQIEEKFYAGGEPESEWYGGIKPGDYVFPIFKGKVIGLWQVKEYGERVNKINKDHSGVVFFEEKKKFDEPIKKFVGYRYFQLNLDILNKAIKPYKSGFVSIERTPECPEPEDIRVEGNMRNLYVMLQDHEDIFRKDEQKSFIEDDIRVLINNIHDTEIMEIQIYRRGSFECYRPLQELYEDRNPENERYTIKELFNYAIKDKAPKKEKYLRAVLDELNSNGYYTEYNPVLLYDNIIVGRKRSYSSASSYNKIDLDDNSNIELEETPEELSTYEKYAELLQFNPNLILYGPPGTGKTYATKRIVECFEMISNDGKYTSFSEIENEGRVKFVTFHQAYSYEESIEGIRPQLDSDSALDNEDENELSYKIEDGILKQLANSASRQYIKKSEEREPGLEQLPDASRI
jgi:5-methylcytosine-specific restriction protein B